MFKKVCFGLSFLCGVSLGTAVTSFAGVENSVHDFSTRSWNISKDLCVACHTPHNSTSGSTPLWNHAMSNATYTVYTSKSLNAKVGQPSPSSKACLSCHDGTVSVGAFGGTVQGSEYTLEVYKLGTDLTNDHPVSFTYDASLATEDGGLYDPTVKTVPAFAGKTIDASMLIDHKVECGTCHDVHGNRGEANSTYNLLVVENTKSKLCLTCHNK